MANEDLLALAEPVRRRSPRPRLPEGRRAMSEWIEWKGGECPVPPETQVEVAILAGPVEGSAGAGGFYWAHHGTLGDIIAYRIVEQSHD